MKNAARPPIPTQSKAAAQALASLVLVIISIFTPALVFAGPPIVTDDTGTPGSGKWEMNMGFTIDKRRSETTYQIPTLDMNYGVGERIQINYSVPWIALHADESTKSGPGNSEIAVKWRFMDESRQTAAVSIYPRFIFNNGTSSADRGIVARGSIFRLPFQVEKKVGLITINGELGHDFHQEGGDEWLYALALKYTEIEGLELLGEAFGTANSRFSKKDNAFNIGIRKDLGENFSLHASVGRSFRPASDQPKLLSYLGVQLRF